MDPDTGPFLKAALFCSDTIEGKDGVLSLIRVIDRLTVAAGGEQVPTHMPRVRQPVKLVLMFVSGRAKGTHDLAIKIERPDTEVRDFWAGTIFLEGEDRGANVVIETEIELDVEGLYWFDVYFGGDRVTRMPFRVIYQRAQGGTASR